VQPPLAPASQSNSDPAYCDYEQSNATSYGFPSSYITLPENYYYQELYSVYPGVGFGGLRLYPSQAACSNPTDSSQLVALAAFALDVCISTEGGYVVYSCQGYTTFVSYYASEGCTGVPTSTQSLVPNGVCAAFQSSVYGSSMYAAPFCNGQFTPVSTDSYIVGITTAELTGINYCFPAQNVSYSSDSSSSSYSSSTATTTSFSAFTTAAYVAEAYEIVAATTVYTDSACSVPSTFYKPFIVEYPYTEFTSSLPSPPPNTYGIL
jgi:hypothetical protein